MMTSKSCLYACAVVSLVGAASALAAPPVRPDAAAWSPANLPAEAASLRLIDGAEHEGPIEQPLAAVYEEDFEGFLENAPLQGQQGWTSSIDAAILELVFPQFDDKSALATALPTNEFITGVMVSPALPATVGTITFDVVIAQDLGHEVLIEVGDIFTGFANTRFVFAPGGGIHALAVVGGAGIFVQTGGFWTPFVPTTMSLTIDEDGQLFAHQDGDLIYGGLDVATDQTGQTNGFSRLSVAINEIGTDQTEYAIDNITLEPAEVIVPADLNGDGVVGPADLALLLGAWGG